MPTTPGWIAVEFCMNILCSQMMSPAGFDDDLSSSATMRLKSFGSDRNILTAVGWIDMKPGSNVHVLFSISCDNFGEPLTFNLEFNLPLMGIHCIATEPMNVAAILLCKNVTTCWGCSGYVEHDWST